MNKRRLYIVEGQIEENFIERMKFKDFINPGKVRVFNLVKNEIKASNVLLQEKDVNFYAIIDTDKWDDTYKQRFLNNIKKMESVGNVYVLVQDKNFEEELAYMIKPENLYDFFMIKSRTKDDLKKHLVKEKYGDKKIGNKNYDDKFNKTHFDKYCVRGERVKDELKNNYRKRIEFRSGKDL